MAKKKTIKKTVRKKTAARKVAKSDATPDGELKKRATAIYRKLVKLYPDAKCALEHNDAFELLIATILSAQCTDVRVNMVTPDLFKKYGSPTAFAKAKQDDLEQAIRSTGFFRNKAKSIKGASQTIVKDYAGKVPDEMDDLLKLPGVARKTANVVLGNAYDKNEGVVVDTHVGRLSQRMGLTGEKDPVKIEKDLMQLFTRKNWTMLSHLLINHGRAVCSSRKPDCENCQLADICEKVGV